MSNSFSPPIGVALGMEGIAGGSISGRSLLVLLPSPRSKRRSHFVPIRASRDGPELDKWEQMELKFGRLLGEDPKLTLAKIRARKSNPDATFLDIEKSLNKKKNKVDDVLINIQSDVSEGQSSESPNSVNILSQKEVTKMPSGRKLSLSRPVMSKAAQATSSDEKPMLIEKKPKFYQENSADKSSNSVIDLRKPSVFQGDDSEIELKLKLKPNIYLKMRKDTSENLSNVTLLKKPGIIKAPLDSEQESVSSVDSTQASSSEIKDQNVMANEIESSSGFQHSDTDLPKSNNSVVVENGEGSVDLNSDSVSISRELGDDLDIGSQPTNQSGVGDYDVSTTSLDENSMYSGSTISSQAAILGKPQRMEPSVKKVSHATISEKDASTDDHHIYTADTRGAISSEQEEIEESDWKKLESLVNTGEKVEVELISCSGRGFVVSFGSLIGFLPYRNVGAKWKFLAFESWLRKKGLDPSLYRQDLGIVRNYDVNNPEMESSKSLDIGSTAETLQPNMKFEDLLQAYDQEKTKFLSSFIGQRIRVTVALADRSSRRIMFSGRPKEKEELVEKKRGLMARLSIGDIVKCCIKKFTYFGIFVEVEGVPALIHQSEVSWDTTLDPSSSFKMGQIVEAKVHQLDYTTDRITLSLKEITPDPLTEALESVVGDRTSLGGSLEAAQADVEWADVELLIKELQKIEEVSNVSKGRFFLSPGLAPTFQVYMAPMFDNKYKLLARYENMVQEVMVQASLDKEQMKVAILECTKRVA
ncbi:uncharacterized protein [Typha latifolia]|uniref:uncharacterized protein isoform X1 n=1 Tax=Typha latifolia TaxID=4733 RepID=UPI003C30DB22